MEAVNDFLSRGWMPYTKLEVKGRLMFQPLNKASQFSVPIVHEPSYQEKVGLSRAYHQAPTGHSGLKHYSAHPGYGVKNFLITNNKTNHNQAELSSRRTGHLGYSGNRSGDIGIRHRISGAMDWTLTETPDLQGDLTRLFKAIGFPSPNAYLKQHSSDIDMAQMACVYRFMRLLTIYGNINGKIAPPDVKAFLEDMHRMAEDNARQRQVHLPPFPPPDYRESFEPMESDGETGYVGHLSVACVVAVESYTGDMGPWGTQPKTKKRLSHAFRQNIAKCFANEYTFNVLRNKQGVITFHEASAMLRMVGIPVSARLMEYQIAMQDWLDSEDTIPVEIYKKYPSFVNPIQYFTSRLSTMGNGRYTFFERTTFLVDQKDYYTQTLSNENTRWTLLGLKEVSTAGQFPDDPTKYNYAEHVPHPDSPDDAYFSGVASPSCCISPDCDPRYLLPEIHMDDWRSNPLEYAVCPLWGSTPVSVVIDGPKRMDGLQPLELMRWSPSEETLSRFGTYAIPSCFDMSLPHCMIKFDPEEVQHHQLRHLPNGNMVLLPPDVREEQHIRDRDTGELRPYKPQIVESIHIKVPESERLADSFSATGETEEEIDQHKGRYLMVSNKGLVRHLPVAYMQLLNVREVIKTAEENGQDRWLPEGSRTWQDHVASDNVKIRFINPRLLTAVDEETAPMLTKN